MLHQSPDIVPMRVELLQKSRPSKQKMKAVAAVNGTFLSKDHRWLPPCAWQRCRMTGLR